VADVFGGETVTIPKSVYEGMMGRLNWLAALEAAGVDNWEGYDVAHQILDGEEVY
jgi:hypothetical protein